MARQTNSDKLKRDAVAVRAKIAAGHEKLAAKFRRKAQQATQRIGETEDEGKRTMHRRRFELYSDAAQQLEDKAIGGTKDAD